MPAHELLDTVDAAAALEEVLRVFLDLSLDDPVHLSYSAEMQQLLQIVLQQYRAPLLATLKAAMNAFTQLRIQIDAEGAAPNGKVRELITQLGVLDDKCYSSINFSREEYKRIHESLRAAMMGVYNFPRL